MVNVVNLRQARKAKARLEKARTAESNRAKFGRTKSERERAKMKADLARKQLEGHKRSTDAPD